MRSLRFEPSLHMHNYFYPKKEEVVAVTAARTSMAGKTCTELMCSTLDEIRAFGDRTIVASTTLDKDE